MTFLDIKKNFHRRKNYFLMSFFVQESGKLRIEPDKKEYKERLEILQKKFNKA